MTDTLKPCPGCGKYEFIRTVKTHSGYIRVGCVCGWYVEAYTEEGAISHWNARHEPEELPEWFVNKLNETIIDCELLEAELKDDNDIEEAVRVSRRANTLRWVLTLRKPEEEE